MGGKRDCADILALGFGTSVAMWAVGFVCRLPAGAIGESPSVPPPTADAASLAVVPPAVLFALLVLCMFAGGFVAGRLSERGWRAGLWSGTLAAVLNLLIVLGVVSGQQTNTLAPSAGIFIPGSIAAGALCGTLGALAGVRFRPAGTPAVVSWCWAMNVVTAGATFLLIFAGGLVTSFSAGLHVPDWPNSFGYLMFFYPLSKMSGGIYYEHCHRLLGTLVGLATLVLVAHTLRHEERPRVRWLAIGALMLVLIQGTLGGLRVTGRLTMSVSRTDMSPSIALAVVHGIVAQIFFCVLVAWSALNSTHWRAATPAPARSAQTDWRLHVVLIGLLVAQLAVGAILRHTSRMLHLHLTLAGLALLAAAIIGVRAWGLYPQQARIGCWAKALLVLAGVQTLTGLCALFTLGFVLERTPSALLQVALTSAHQTGGVLVLGSATLLLVWSRRLLTPAAP
jgi:cytochrome c oxidase assembly protein subunit 15